MRRFLGFCRLHLSQERILGGALVLSVTQVIASVAGLFRDRLLTQTFPGLSVVDVYIASFRPSDLLFQMGIMAAFSTVLVPLLSRYSKKENMTELSQLFSSVLSMASLLFGSCAVVLALSLPWLAPFLTGFQGDDLALYVSFARLALLTNALFLFGNAFGQFLITRQRYWVYGLTPVLYTLGTITGTVLFTPYVGAYGPMYGTCLGAALYSLWRAVAALRLGLRLQPRLLHPELLTMGWLMLPRIAALGAWQVEFLLFDSLASHLEAGSITINAYARNFQSVAVGAVGIALAQSAFPLLSQAAAENSLHRFWMYVRKSTLLTLGLTVPAAVALVLLAPVAARLVHLSAHLPVFWMSLAAYAFSIPFESLNHLLMRAYYARQQTAIPAFVTVVSVVVAVITCTLLISRLGMYSLALAYTTGNVVQTIILAACLRSAAKRS